MAWRQNRWAGCALAVVMSVQSGGAQTTMPQSSADALHALAQLAGVIFSGEVIAVRRPVGADGESGVVEIDFSVEDAVRGVSASTYTVREWAGLWPGNDAPFRVGQRFLMLLHAPGPGGLSSPVGGMDGAIPIGASAVAGQSGTSVVDLSWVQTRVMRPVSYRTLAAAQPITVHAKAVSSAGDSSGDTVAVASPQGTLAPMRAEYGTVLDALRGWEKDDSATR